MLHPGVDQIGQCSLLFVLHIAPLFEILNIQIFFFTDVYDKLCAHYPELGSRLKEEARSYKKKKVNRFKSAITIQANNGIAGLFSKKKSSTSPKSNPFGKKKKLSPFGVKKAISLPAPNGSPKATGLFGALKSSKGKSLLQSKKTSEKNMPSPEEEQTGNKFNPLKKRFTITATADESYSMKFHEKMKSFVEEDGNGTAEENETEGNEGKEGKEKDGAREEAKRKKKLARVSIIHQEIEEENNKKDVSFLMSNDNAAMNQMKEMTKMFEVMAKNMTEYQTNTNQRLDSLTKTIELFVEQEKAKSAE